SMSLRLIQQHDMARLALAVRDAPKPLELRQMVPDGALRQEAGTPDLTLARRDAAVLLLILLDVTVDHFGGVLLCHRKSRRRPPLLGGGGSRILLSLEAQT